MAIIILMIIGQVCKIKKLKQDKTKMKKIENLNFPLPPIFSPFLVQFRKKKHEFAKNWYPMLCFLFFLGGENNHLCILNLEFHIGAFMAPKL